MQIEIRDEGSITILEPMDGPADEWLRENLASDVMRWGDGYVIEPRYLPDILAGFEQDGGIYS
jgi:hypothetical protein